MFFAYLKADLLHCVLRLFSLLEPYKEGFLSRFQGKVIPTTGYGLKMDYELLGGCGMGVVPYP